MKENPPEQILIDKVYRNILADKPRITRYNIKWDDKIDIEEEDKAQAQTCESSQTRGREESFSELFSSLMSESSKNLLDSFTPEKNPFLTSGNGFM